MMIRNALRTRSPTAPRSETSATVMTLDELLTEWSRENADRPSAALSSSPVAAAHRILTNSIGAMPIALFQKQGARRVPVSNHRALYPLTVRANTHMSPMVFKKVMASRCFWYGEAFAYPDMSVYPMQLLPLPPKPIMYEDDKTGERWYAFQPAPGIAPRKFNERELIHLYFETGDGRTGVGMLQIARETIATDLNAQKFAGKFYKQGARPSGIIEVPTKTEQENKDKVRDAFERMAGGLDGAFRVAVLDLGMKYTQLGITQKDAQFIESRNFSVEEISRFTGVPLHKLQAGKQSYNSNEAQGIDYVVSTLQPIVVQWEQELGYKLLLGDEAATMYWKFNLAAEMRGDNKTRAEFYQIMVANSIMTPNECRALEDRDDREGADELLVTKNLTTLKNIDAATEPAGG